MLNVLCTRKSYYFYQIKISFFKYFTKGKFTSNSAWYYVILEINYFSKLNWQYKII